MLARKRKDSIVYKFLWKKKKKKEEKEFLTIIRKPRNNFATIIEKLLKAKGSINISFSSKRYLPDNL